MTLLKRFCRALLYKKMGWTTDIKVEHPAKYIICLAPHTSNWDFIIGLLFSRAEDMKINFLMKKEWFFWPLGTLFRHFRIYRRRLSCIETPQKGKIRNNKIIGL